jgi:hypothetical protein
MNANAVLEIVARMRKATREPWVYAIHIEDVQRWASELEAAVKEEKEKRG